MDTPKTSSIAEFSALKKSLSDYQTCLNETLTCLKSFPAQGTNPIYYPIFDRFDGSEPYKAEAWMNNCKRMLKLNKIDQTLWVAPIVVSLFGQASIWYQGLELANNKVQLTWTEFEKAFEDRWYEDDKQKFYRSRQLIANWKWNKDFEKFYATYEHIRAMVSEKEYPENLLIEEFKKRLPSDYRSYTIGWKLNDIPSMRKDLLKFHCDLLDQAQQAQAEAETEVKVTSSAIVTTKAKA